MTIEQTEDNLSSMTELALANHIKVVLCSVLPAFDFAWRPGLTPAARVDRLNAWLRKYAAEKGVVDVDCHSAMKDARNGLPSNLSKDGVSSQCRWICGDGSTGRNRHSEGSGEVKTIALRNVRGRPSPR